MLSISPTSDSSSSSNHHLHILHSTEHYKTLVPLPDVVLAEAAMESQNTKEETFVCLLTHAPARLQMAKAPGSRGGWASMSPMVTTVLYCPPYCLDPLGHHTLTGDRICDIILEPVLVHQL